MPSMQVLSGTGCSNGTILDNCELGVFSGFEYAPMWCTHYEQRPPSSMASLGEGPPSGCCSASGGGVWVREARLSFKGVWFETWVEVARAMAGPRPGCNMAELQLWWDQVLWLQPKAAPLGRGQSWSLSLQQDGAAAATPEPHSQEGGCFRGLPLTLKKTWKKVSPSAVRAALGFSLKHLRYLWAQIPEFFEVYFAWSIKNKHGAGAMTTFFF